MSNTKSDSNANNQKQIISILQKIVCKALNKTKDNCFSLSYIHSQKPEVEVTKIGDLNTQFSFKT